MSTSQTASAAASTDYAALLKDAFHGFIKGENLVPLIVGALAVFFAGFTVILLPPMLVGYVGTCIKIARGEPVKIDDLWSGFKHFGSAFVLGLIAAVLVGIGFALFVVPGLVLAFLFAFAFHALAMNPEIGAGGAIKESIRLVKANAVDVLVLWLVGGVLLAVLTWTVVGTFAAEAYIALLSAMLFVRMRQTTPPPA